MRIVATAIGCCLLVAWCGPDSGPTDDDYAQLVVSEKPYLTEITIESVDDTTTGCELVSGNAILGDDIMVVREDRSAADICDDAELESEFDVSTEPPTLLERRGEAGAKVDSALEMVAKEAIVGEFG